MTSPSVFRCAARADRRLAAVLVAVAMTTSCAGATRHAGSASTARVEVTLENFKIDVPAQIHAGLTRFMVTGVGPTMHEFNVVRTRAGRKDLPVGNDHLVDDQNPHPDFDHLGEVEGIDIGQHKSLTISLPPGHYVLYCNMDGHYAFGMNADLTVLP